jgi:hypothetical protein
MESASTKEFYMVPQTLGEIGYTAYCVSSGGKSLVSGADLPVFDKLSDAIKTAWEAAGQAVAASVGRADAR